MEVFRSLMTRLGLTVNERKTRLAKLPEESFDFLGYTIGRFYGRDGQSYIGTRPSKKAVRKLLLRIHEETSSRWNWQLPEKRIPEINLVLRGWCGYFNQGPVAQVYRLIRQVHGATFPQMADAAGAASWHGIQTVSRRLPCTRRWGCTNCPPAAQPC